MKKKRFDLSPREQRVMDLFWDTQEELTSLDIYDRLHDIMLNPSYVHRSLNILLEKKCIEECGSIRCNKQYARKFKPSFTREEFAANMLRERGIGLASLQKISMAFIAQDDLQEETKEQTISQLQQVIDSLRGDGGDSM